MSCTIGQIDNLGKRLREQKEILPQDLDLLQEYRKSNYATTCGAKCIGLCFSYSVGTYSLPVR